MRTHAPRLSALLLVTAMLGAQVPTAHAGDAKACYGRMVSEMVAVHDAWRAQLFGSRRGTDGSIVVLTGGEAERERTGIFETKGRLTSELVEPLVESYRVYRCRTLAVCQIAANSINVESEAFDLTLLGCAEQRVDRYQECAMAGATVQSDATDVLDQCRKLASETLASERAMLKMAVAYDSGYRSLLQFAGIMDWMLQGFPTGTIRVIADMVGMLGKLHQIPCFIGQCDNPNTAEITP